MRIFCEDAGRKLSDERKIVLELISEARTAAKQVQEQIQVCLSDVCFYLMPVIPIRLPRP